MSLSRTSLAATTDISRKKNMYYISLKKPTTCSFTYFDRSKHNQNRTFLITMTHIYM